MILQQLQRLLGISSDVSSEPDAPTAYIARLLKRILSRLRGRSRLASPIGDANELLSLDPGGNDLLAMFDEIVRPSSVQFLIAGSKLRSG